ncbi:centromere protein M [Antechinus flavipes]|uniref:centromere protein M n=1 Tax=Antechinus flavipes TaxID=38775 RepID=UPI002235760D|nr:centromere protein M [Antechinus flavipes]
MRTGSPRHPTDVFTGVKMALLRPLDKLPTLDVATILLLGAEETLLQQLGAAIIEQCEGMAKIQVHMASSLPLPSDRECFRPRIDLIVFVLSLHSKYSLKTVESSLPHVDASFFLGKVCFLVTGARNEQNSGVHLDTVKKMAATYHSPLLFADLEVKCFRVSMAQRLIRILQICAGHVPGLSALNLLSMMKGPLDPSAQECD